MTPPKIIRSWEHKPIDDPVLEEYREWLNQHDIDRKEPETLGLHEKSGSFAPGNYIGMVWLGSNNQAILRADSKFPAMDYVAMYAECAAHPIIGERLHCLHVWP